MEKDIEIREEFENLEETFFDDEPIEEKIIIEKKEEKQKEKEVDKITILYAKVVAINKLKNKTYLDCDGIQICVRGAFYKNEVIIHYSGNLKKKYKIISVE